MGWTPWCSSGTDVYLWTFSTSATLLWVHTQTGRHTNTHAHTATACMKNTIALYRKVALRILFRFPFSPTLHRVCPTLCLSLLLLNCRTIAGANKASARGWTNTVQCNSEQYTAPENPLRVESAPSSLNTNWTLWVSLRLNLLQLCYIGLPQSVQVLCCFPCSFHEALRGRFIFVPCYMIRF